MILSLNQQANKYAAQIRGRLLAEQARDLSDVELDRCLAPCVLGAPERSVPRTIYCMRELIREAYPPSGR